MTNLDSSTPAFSQFAIPFDDEDSELCLSFDSGIFLFLKVVLNNEDCIQSDDGTLLFLRTALSDEDKGIWINFVCEIFPSLIEILSDSNELCVPYDAGAFIFLESTLNGIYDTNVGG